VNRRTPLCLMFVSSPEGKVRAAVRALQRAGVPLLYGEPGVFWCRDQRAWMPAPRHPVGVSLVGAVLLAYQTEPFADESGAAPPSQRRTTPCS
jgi:hypothetical protein